MTTDYKIHTPKSEYTATIKVTATKEELKELYRFVEASELREYRDSKIFDELLNEIKETIHTLDDYEKLSVQSV